jgi:hypothetical protein
MDAYRMATRNVSAALNAELARFGGRNPFSQPTWRVVRAEDCFEQAFGTMRHMPRLNADSEVSIEEVEPEAFSSGEMWLPKYEDSGFGLERWFPANVWGSQFDWEHETAEDGTTRLKGEFPRHGGYYMVGDRWHPRVLAADAWKAEIGKWMASQAANSLTPAAALGRNLYMSRLREQQKREAFDEEVNQIHRTITAPTLATIGRTAQLVREEMAEQAGWTGHLAAG